MIVMAIIKQEIDRLRPRARPWRFLEIALMTKRRFEGPKLAKVSRAILAISGEPSRLGNFPF